MNLDSQTSQKPYTDEELTKQYLVVTFYKFISIKDCLSLQAELLQLMLDLQIKGTIILAPEGINSTVSGLKENVQNFIQKLLARQEFVDLEFKFAHAAEQAFKRSKVRIKKEIVTFQFPLEFTTEVGKYVAAADWNKLISDPEVLLIDTRNDFEVELGTFKGALNPQTQKFTEIKQFSDELLDNIFEKQNSPPKKIAMFCTGGIRCEKYSAYLMQKCQERGFDQIYHLQGGILKYLEETPPEQSLWQGECFVFDERRQVSPEDYHEAGR